MWFYENVTREEFEKVKDKVEEIMLSLGAEVFPVKLPYKQKLTNYTGEHIVTWYSYRPVFKNLSSQDRCADLRQDFVDD